MENDRKDVSENVIKLLNSQKEVRLVSISTGRQFFKRSTTKYFYDLYLLQGSIMSHSSGSDDHSSSF